MYLDTRGSSFLVAVSLPSPLILGCGRASIKLHCALSTFLLSLINMFDLVDVILFLLISIVFSSQLLSIRNRTMDNPNPPAPIFNPRGRRRPLIPNLNRHQPPREKPRFFTSTYEVTPEDITEVKDILVKARNLPLELVDMILDDAEYWVCSSTIIDHDDSESGRISIHGAREGENQFLVSKAS